MPDGSKIIVTNENKREYLNALAQYRLATKAKPQVDAFLKGLNEVVPDELLSIFDENELEVRSFVALILFATYIYQSFYAFYSYSCAEQVSIALQSFGSITSFLAQLEISAKFLIGFGPLLPI